MPRFSVNHTTANELESICLTDSHTAGIVRVLPRFGGNLAELILSDGEVAHPIIDGYQTADEAREHKGYRGALLFPFPNRIRDGRYQFDGTEYQLPINRTKENNAIHGFFTNRSFRVVTETANDEFAELALSVDYGGDYPGYPFTGEINLCYRLDRTNGFTSVVSVTNTGEQPIPVGVGWHPYFSLNTRIDRLKLRLPTSEVLLLDERKLPTGKSVQIAQFVEPTPIECSQLDTAFRLDAGGNDATTELIDPEIGLTLSLTQATGPGQYNYLQVYTPPDRETIAIEPMTCPADSFNSDEGLIRLEPGETNSCRFTVRLRRADR